MIRSSENNLAFTLVRCAAVLALIALPATIAFAAGDGTFGPNTDFAQGGDPSSVALADVNGDGALDAVTANGFSDNISVLLGIKIFSIDQLLQNMTVDIEQLLTDGDINNGVANPLRKILRNIERSLARDNSIAACNQLWDFIDTTQDKIDSGKLSSEDGQPLIDTAQSMIDQLKE